MAMVTSTSRGDHGPMSTQTAFRTAATASAPAANIVVYRVTYPWKVFTPLIGQIVGNDGIIELMAYSVVKNEPY